VKNKKRKQSQNQNRVFGAVILGVIIVIVFVQRTNMEWLQNWWALLFLIPAIASVNNAYTEYKAKKGFTFTLASNLMGIIFPVAIGLMLLLGVNGNTSIPIVIILAGLSLLIIGFVNEDKNSVKIIRTFRYWIFSWGLAEVLVGIITLIATLQTNLNPQTVYIWYGVAILVASLGGWITSWNTFKKEGKLTFVTLAHIFTSLVITIPGILAILN
jgi:hypothetical protein